DRDRRCGRSTRRDGSEHARRAGGGGRVSAPDFEALAVGEVVAEHTFTLTRDRLVRYAGASGDFNPIHYRDDVAQSVGLPGVLAHGMLTMGVAASPALEWLGSAGWPRDYQVR